MRGEAGQGPAVLENLLVLLRGPRVHAGLRRPGAGGLVPVCLCGTLVRYSAMALSCWRRGGPSATGTPRRHLAHWNSASAWQTEGGSCQGQGRGSQRRLLKLWYSPRCFCGDAGLESPLTLRFYLGVRRGLKPCVEVCILFSLRTLWTPRGWPFQAAATSGLRAGEGCRLPTSHGHRVLGSLGSRCCPASLQPGKSVCSGWPFCQAR